MSVDTVLLRYAIKDGKPVGVTAFDHLRGIEGGREDLYCPECEGRVTVRLSPEHKKRDHFAHLPDSTCALRNGGESAIHQNAKFYLADQLRRFRSASLIVRCAGCQNDFHYLKFPEYDSVETELKLNSRRPDISCLHAGQTVAAAEICHTNAVNFTRRVDLDSYRIAWFEIPALNVHPKFLRFVDSAAMLGIDASGAGVTYPVPPKYCDVCEARNQRRQAAQQGRDLAYDQYLAGFSQTARIGRMLDAAQAASSAAPTMPPRSAMALEIWDQADQFSQGQLLAFASKEGITLAIDEYGPRVTPSLSGGLYIAILNYRKARFLEKKGAALQKEHKLRIEEDME